MTKEINIIEDIGKGIDFEELKEKEIDDEVEKDSKEKGE